jgi:hypothetical protein
MILPFDLAISAAAANCDNDAALEHAIDQKNFFEGFCSDPDQQSEWRRRALAHASR